MSETESESGVLAVTGGIRVPRAEFHFTYVRSSGPGGQNVNKVATKAQLRWNVVESPALPDDVRERFLARFGRRITNDGELVVSSQRFRDQSKNAADCLEKVREMVRSVATPPRPRKKTRPSRRSVERRLQDKKRRSERKQNRRSPRHDD